MLNFDHQNLKRDQRFIRRKFTVLLFFTRKNVQSQAHWQYLHCWNIFYTYLSAVFNSQAQLNWILLKETVIPRSSNTNALAWWCMASAVSELFLNTDSIWQELTGTLKPSWTWKFWHRLWVRFTVYFACVDEKACGMWPQQSLCWSVLTLLKWIRTCAYLCLIQDTFFFLFLLIHLHHSVLTHTQGGKSALSCRTYTENHRLSLWHCSCIWRLIRCVDLFRIVIMCGGFFSAKLSFSTDMTLLIIDYK